MRIRICVSCLLLMLIQVAVRADVAAFPQWLPFESWPGGRQGDARLGRTVTMWGAGLSLPEVLSEIARQTGVRVEASPPDQAALTRVTLYLDPSRPPALRDLLVQLSWVLDSDVAFAGAGGSREYQLLLPSARLGVMAELAEEAHENRPPPRHDGLRDTAGQWEALARLQELERALGLRKEELIARYRGRDDALLLAALDPARRAGAQFLLSLPDEELAGLAAGKPLVKEVSALPKEQQDRVQALSGQPDLDRVRAAGLESEGDIEQVWGGIGNDGAVVLNWSRPGVVIGTLTNTVVIPAGRDLELPNDIISLKRLLGEAVTPEYERQVKQDYEARNKLQHDKELEAAWGSASSAVQGMLSPELQERLSHVFLQQEPEKGYTLWEVQQAVARATGLDVVSDYFWQPERRPQDGPSSGPEVSALEMLSEHCMGLRERYALLAGDADPWTLAWHWEGLGSFLRFRSRERDVWRASVLPPDVLARLDAQLSRYLPDMEHPQAWGRSVEVRLDPRHYYWLLPQLTQAQARWGGKIGYESPEGPLARARGALRAIVLEAALDPLSGFFAALDEDQWAQLRQQGLRLYTGLTLEQRGLVVRAIAQNTPTDPDLQGAVLRLEPADSLHGTLWGGNSPQPSVDEAVTDLDTLTCRQGSAIWLQSPVARLIRLRLRLPPYPKEAPAAAESRPNAGNG